MNGKNLLRAVGVKSPVGDARADEIKVGVEHPVTQSGGVRQCLLQLVPPELFPVDEAILAYLPFIVFMPDDGVYTVIGHSE